MNFPKNWNCKTLGEVCTFTRGLTYKKKDEVGVSNNVVLRANNIDLQGNRLNFDELKYIDDRIAIPDTKKVKKNSLLVCISSGSKKHLGKVAYIDDEYPYAFGGFMGMLTPKTLISPRYFYWFMQSKAYKDHLESLSDGLNINNLKFDQLKPLVIPLPPFPEQQRIVAILDDAFERIDAAIANTEKNLANDRELFESYLNDVFAQKGEGWEKKKLGELCSVKHGFAFKSKFFCKNSEYIVLTPGNFYETGGFRDQGKKTKYYDGEIPDGFILKENDFLIAMTEQAKGLLGSSLIVPESDVYLHNQRLGLVQKYEGVIWDNLFFHYQLNTRRFRDAVQDTASGVKVRHTSPKKLLAIPVTYPTSIEGQRKVASAIQELKVRTQELERIYLEKLSALAELKQSILQKAFSGELTADMNKEALVN